MSNQIDRNPALQERSTKKWSVLRSRTVPAGVKLKELDAYAGAPHGGEGEILKKADSLPAALHNFPGYSEADSRLLKR